MKGGGLAVSAIAHAALIAWGIFALPSARPIDASSIEQIPVDFIEMADVTKINKGVQTAALVQDVPVPEPAKKIVDEPPPLPKPEPVPKPEPAPPLPPPPAPAPPQPTPPDPAPTPDVTPPVPAEPTPPPPEPKPDAEPPPPDTTASVTPPPKDVPLPRIRPTPPQKPKQAPPDATSDIDQITALLDKRKLEQMAAAEPPAEAKPTVGSATGSASVSKMTANELDLLRARLAQCWSPPLGWTDPAEVRVVLMLELNEDGTVAGTPTVLESPQGQYSNTAPESALRAVRRCAPYNLPAEKYDAWKQVKVTFDPRDMGGA
jgi:hypothetical protein